MEYLLVNMARNRDATRFDYRAAYVVDIPNPVVPELEALGVPCTRLGTGHSADPRWIADLRALVRDERIDIVHIHSPQTAAAARPALLTMRHRPRILYTEHNSWSSYRFPTRILNAATYVLNDDQIAVSDDVVSSIGTPLRNRTEPIIHGIDRDALRRTAAALPDPRVELGISEDTAVIVAVANLKSQKAYGVMLDAARELIDGRHDVVFLSVGQGPLRAELEARRDALGLADRFRFLGYRSDVAALLATADLFTLSSEFEGLPVAVMEAMSLGVPVVATAVGGIPSAVDDGTTGRLVPAGDSRALAAAYRDVLDDDERRAAMVAASLERSAMFDAAAVTATIEERYDRLMGRK